jgi:hypothetical protein
MKQSEGIRRTRLSDLRRLLNHRYGTSLPDDDAGREDLRELLMPISLGPDPQKRMLNAIGLWASWMPQDEIGLLIEDIERTEPKERKRTAKDLGERMNLTNELRGRLGIRTIAACDLTTEQAAEWRKAKRREQQRKRRAANGAKPRAEYERNSINRTKPWIAAGISRATWFRKRETGMKPMNSLLEASHLSQEARLALSGRRAGVGDEVRQGKARVRLAT